MIRRMRVVRAPAVEEWLAAPHRDPTKATSTRVRFAKAVHMIEHAGTLASDDYLKKLPGYEALWETTVGDRRVFSTISGSVVLMAVVVEKKKQRLKATQLKSIEAQVNRFAETWREENQGNPSK